MRTFTYFLITLLFSLSSFAQLDSTKIPFVAYWSIDDSYNFKISKISQQWKEGKIIKDTEDSYIANFEVIDSTDISYTIKWTFKNDIANKYDIPEKFIEKLSKYEFTELKYKTSEVGDFIEILNWEEIGEMMNNMFDDMTEIIADNDQEKLSALKNSMAPIKQAMSSKQGVEELMFKEIQYFHFPMGLEYDISEPLKYEESLPNMFGGKPIKADASIYFENVNFEDGFCVVQQEMSLNPDDTKTMLSEAFQKMNMSGDKMEEFLNNSTVKIDDYNTYEYYFNPGIPHRIETTRTSIIKINKKEGKRIDKTIIELLYEE